MKRSRQNIFTLMLSILLFSNCSLLDIDPKHVVSSEKAFDDVDSYQMALNMLYLDLTKPVFNFQATDFATDDFASVVAGYAPTNYYIYNWDYNTQPQPFVWRYQSQLIARANVITDNYDVVPAETESERRKRDQVYAQALGVRAWCFFNLVQLYAPRYDGTNGDELSIPLKTTLELQYLPKSTLSEVYEQIYDDLTEAELLYGDDNSSSAYEFGIDAIRATRARVALFQNDLAKAKEASSHFINTPLLSKENYWMTWEDQFGTINNEVLFMTHDLSDTNNADLVDYHEMYVTNNALLDQDFISSFDEGDVRKEPSYISANRMSFKHVIPINDRNAEIDRNLHYKHFRLAEQYLIYAESVLAEDGDEAMRVLNLLKAARGAKLLTTAPTKRQILEERRKELFTEGLRFYDLKRLSSELNIIVERKNGKTLTPNSPYYIWTIPIEETNSNPYIN